MPDLSVITATRGRPEALEAKARSLAGQTLAAERFEWIVAFDGDASDARRRWAAAAPPCPTRGVELSARVGAGAARNAAVADARAETLVFSDDDCLLDPDTLERHLHAQATPCVAVGPVRFVDAHERTTLATRAFARPRWWHLHGANTSVPTGAFRCVGGFDARLRGYGGEDLLLGWRLHRLGLPVRGLGGGAVAHLGPDPTRGGDVDKARSAGRNAAMIADLEPALAWRLGVHPALLAAKAVVLESPLRRGAARLAPGWARYERAYASGARDWRTRTNASTSRTEESA